MLYLVDLAGSERIKKSKASGERLDEAISINSSLSTLGIRSCKMLVLLHDKKFTGNCIHALTEIKRGHVPFRESKLTRILQDSLGGNCKTSLIVNIGPSIVHYDETVSSLLFGLRAMKVQNRPIINKQTDYYVINITYQNLKNSNSIHGYFRSLLWNFKRFWTPRMKR